MSDTLYDIAEIENQDETERDSGEKGQLWYAKTIGMCLVGLCFSGLNALGDMSPFAVSFLSVVNFEMCFPCFIGSAVGYFLVLPWQSALKYCFALSITAFFRLFMHRRFKAIEGGAANLVVCISAILMSGLTYLLFQGFDFYSVLMLIVEAALGFCSGMFFLRAFRTPVMNIGIANLGAKDSVSLVMSLCIFLLCMSGFTVEGISPARMLSCLAVMFAALYKGASAGAVTGVCLGAALCISPDFRHLFPAYALGGLVAGVFSPFGQVGVAGAFSVCFGAVCVISGIGEGFIVSIIELGVAFAAFLIVPVRYLTTAQDFLLRSGMLTDNQVNKRVSADLYRAAENIYEVSKIVCSVSDRLDNVINPEVNRLFANIQQRVCDGCSSKAVCWNKSFDTTAADILSMAGIEGRGKVRSETEKRCIRRESLISFINAGRREYAESMATKMKIREMRRVLTDQFSAVGDFFCEVGDKVKQDRVLDSARSLAIKTAIRDAGVPIDALSYFTDGSGAVTVEITVLDKPFDTDRKKVKTIMELMTKRHFSEPEITVTDIRTTIMYRERLPFSIIYGVSQKPFGKNSLCGDTVALTNTDNHSCCALISDGMGTGKRAAVDSVMTASVTEKLLSAGFSFDSSLRIVNSAMIAKSTDESIATIDGVQINLFTGRIDFYKAGAAVSFVRKGNNVISVEESSLPIGILRDISFAKSSVQLEAGDIVLLVSDGVTAGDCGWISDELLSWSTNSMEDLAKHITGLAALRTQKELGDDLTVLAVKLVRSKK